MSTPKNMTVKFLHPRDAREFQAEVGLKTTGAQAIEGLVKAGFVEPAGGDRSYVLQAQKTGRSLTQSEPLSAQGVADGDVVAVTETSAGAGK